MPESKYTCLLAAMTFGLATSNVILPDIWQQNTPGEINLRNYFSSGSDQYDQISPETSYNPYVEYGSDLPSQQPNLSREYGSEERNLPVNDLQEIWNRLGCTTQIPESKVAWWRQQT